MSEVVLRGPDGANPLGFLCALGLLRILDSKLSRGSGGAPRLSWVDEGYWRPVLHLSDERSEPLSAVMEDLESWRNDPPEFRVVYRKAGKAKDIGEEGGEIRDLKAPPDVFRRFLEDAAVAARRGERRPAAFAAAYGSDVAFDRQGNTKPTAFHFTAGQQHWIGRILMKIAAGLTVDQVREAIHGPWRRGDAMGVLRWDTAGERLYALMANAPTDDKPLGEAGAEWLAFQALPLFPSFPVGTRLRTTGFFGDAGDTGFVWPIWTVAATLRGIRSLLADPAVATGDALWREGRGVACVYRAAVRRQPKGYGNFGAAEVIPPGGAARNRLRAPAGSRASAVDR